MGTQTRRCDGNDERPPNHLFRQARGRLRTPAGTVPSRREIADLVNVYLYDTDHSEPFIDRNYVGKIESGRIRWPSPIRRAAFRHVLGVRTDADIGFWPGDRGVGVRPAVETEESVSNPGPDTVPTANFARSRGELNGDQALTNVGTGVQSSSGDLPRLRQAELPRQALININEHDATADQAELDPAADATLRVRLAHYRWNLTVDPLPLADLEAAVAAANRAYQRAEYAMLDGLPAMISGAEHIAVVATGDEQRRAYQMLAWANLVASKLAAKLGDGPLAWLTADRAASWAVHLDDPALLGVAAYQIACALAKTPGRAGEAEDVAMVAVDRLGGHRRRGVENGYLSIHGALLLHAAVTAARHGDREASRRRLDAAAGLAEQFGHDGNEYWTAFGPTNVLLHRLAVAVALGDTTDALDLADHIDTSGMPSTLVSRRAQVHIDLAALHCQTRHTDPQAVLHLLEAERIAPQIISRSAEARQLLSILLRRERRSTTPGLRPLAERAGVGMS